MATSKHDPQTSLSPDNQPAKLIALYFPQFHAIPENDLWWGDGFTDWDNVKSAAPLFEGHYQPRIPLANNYYDQSKIETIRWQIALAKQHGIFGFCHYHYWFDGKQLLETPTNIVLENKDLDLPFCLSWANETWSRRWEGRDYDILVQQSHPPVKASWKKHYDYLIRAWKDPRAIKVDDKPVFVIYRPQRIERISDMLTYWRELAIQDGLPGLYFIYQKQYELTTSGCLELFDAAFQFQPFEAIYSSTLDTTSIGHALLFRIFRLLPEYLQDLFRGFRTSHFKDLTFHDYDAVWRNITEIRPDQKLTTYPGAFIDWDNTPRYKSKATLFNGANPKSFEKWFSLLVDSMNKRNLPENYIFINAWNEWSEGTYLEPDEKLGYQYLEVLKGVLCNANGKLS